MTPNSRRRRAVVTPKIVVTNEQGTECVASSFSSPLHSRYIPLNDGKSRTIKKAYSPQLCGAIQTGSPHIKLLSSSRTVKCHHSQASRFACKSPGSLLKKSEAYQNELGVKTVCMKKREKENSSVSDKHASPIHKFHPCQNGLLSKSRALRKHQRKKSCNSEVISCDTPDRNNTCHVINQGIGKNNLGKGAYGTVVRGKYKGQEIAVKIVSKSGFDSLKKEANGVCLIHPNVVRVFKIEQSGDYGMVLMERNFGPDLQAVLWDANIFLRPSDRLRYMLNISEALEYCHSQGILHLDVKPKNILLCAETNNCKLCDFGTSVKIEELQVSPTKCNTGVNTIRYTDPQLFLGKLPSTKSDVYSLGITMWQMISRKIPYEGEDDHSIIFKVISKEYRPEEVMDFADEDEDYKHLYKCCWSADPAQRPDSSVVSAKLAVLLRHLNHET